MKDKLSKGNKEKQMTDIKHPFQVPEAYFDTLYNDILDRKATYRSFKRYYTYKWVTVAVVASISLVLVWSGMFYWNYNSELNNLSDVSTEAMIEYLALDDVSYDWLINIDANAGFELEDVNYTENAFPVEDVNEESLQLWLDEYSEYDNDLML